MPPRRRHLCPDVVVPQSTLLFLPSERSRAQRTQPCPADAAVPDAVVPRSQRCRAVVPKSQRCRAVVSCRSALSRRSRRRTPRPVSANPTRPVSSPTRFSHHLLSAPVHRQCKCTRRRFIQPFLVFCSINY